MNEDIRVPEVRLIDQTGQNVGVVSTADALVRATEAGLDLVEISPDASPPVAKILDFGKYKYQEQKKAAEARKKQKVVEIKEIKMRPSIDDHDYDVKMRSIRRFFEEGDKVKVTLRFRGRELSHQELGWQVLQRVKADTEQISKVEVRAAHGRPPDGDGAGTPLAPPPHRRPIDGPAEARGAALASPHGRLYRNARAARLGMPWRLGCVQ